MECELVQTWLLSVLKPPASSAEGVDRHVNPLLEDYLTDCVLSELDYFFTFRLST